MKQILDDWCNYRRYCWNQALALWQDLYMARTIFDKVVATTFIPKQNKKTKKWRMTHQDYHLNPSPNWRLVRDLMIEQKEDWQYAYSARTLQLAVQDLGKAWQNFFNKAQPDYIGINIFTQNYDIVRERKIFCVYGKNSSLIRNRYV